MRFQGNVVENLKAAAKSNDTVLIGDLLIDEMANIIEKNPTEMIKTLRNSKVDISDMASQDDLVSAASYNLHNNRIFQKNIAVMLVKKGSAQPHDYAGAEGGGGEGGGGGGNIVSSIADMVGSISQWGASNQNLKAEEQRTKGKMYEKIFGGQQKRNWMPIIVVAGVLLIGAMVVWRVTAKK